MIVHLITPTKRFKLKIPMELDSEEVVNKIKQRLGEKASKVHFAYGTSTSPPTGSKPPKGMLWCPYCRDFRKFKSHSKDHDRKVCSVCGISTKDFYVRVHNLLWRE